VDDPSHDGLCDIRHETLVDDFEGETREVLNFLGLGWDPAVWDFPRRARARARTPSDEQLAGGLSREGMGQWRRYRNAMAPVLPLLRPWVEYYGYPVD